MSHNCMGQVWSVKTVLHSSLRMEREEMVPLGPLSLTLAHCACAQSVKIMPNNVTNHTQYFTIAFPTQNLEYNLKS